MTLESDLRGAGRLAVDLTLLATDVVETMHRSIAGGPGLAGHASRPSGGGLTGFVYRSVRDVTRLAGHTLDALLPMLVPPAWDTTDRPRHDALVGALNGILGDHLEASGNPLALPMELRHDQRPLPAVRGAIARRVPRPRDRAVVMVHGLCATDAIWDRRSPQHARRLAEALEGEALYLRYNSGRHISTNGAEFAGLLERLVEEWPVPLRELVLVGHSMGGLVIRSACATGQRSGHRWVRRLRALVLLGAPHHGAPLERGGHGLHLLLEATPYTLAFTRIARLRSAGITDLRHGSVLEADWRGRDRFARAGYRRHRLPLPHDVPVFAVAGSLSTGSSDRGRWPRGDGLVPVASALGVHPDRRMALDLPPSGQWIAYGTGHLDLLSSETVFEQTRAWLGSRRRSSPPGPAGPPGND